ncbi:MAG: ABC transporter substrate-binding protein, partial [Eubacteriales bacterium]
SKNFSTLKTYIGTLGTWINNIQSQALTIDYIIIQPAGGELPRAEANFFQDAWYEIKSFFYSFVRDNSSFGSAADGDDVVSIEVWTTVSREYAQIIRNLIDDSFAKSYPNVSVTLKLVAGGTLLPATLAGDGPDLMMGEGSSTVMNYAVRGAILDLTGYDEFEEVKSRFIDAAMIPLTVAVGSPDGDIAVYGIPQTMSFSVMFYRKDIFADLGIKVPSTWDEFREIIPRLQSRNYTVGMSKDTNTFIYQNGGTLYKENGTKISYDTDISLDAFTTMCEFFTLYRFPITYDAANRFRTGEMPLIMADFISFYNQFTVFATELKGLWAFTNIPGTVQEDGSVNNSHVAGVSAMVIMKDAKPRGTDAAAFKFMEWWTRANVQGQYANELIALLGPAGKYNTANTEAFKEMSWTASELRLLEGVFDSLVGVPEMPGSYIISRYVNFAFLAAYNNGKSPSDELLSYVDIINKEFERKREELNREFYIPASSHA